MKNSISINHAHIVTVIKSALHNLLNNSAIWVERLVPEQCPLCLDKVSSNIGVCDACWEDLPKLSARCRVCATAISSDASVCGNCLSNPPEFDKVSVPFSYAFPMDCLIRRLKYGNQYTYARNIVLATTPYFRQTIMDTADKPECLIPVPLHRKRMQQRGFNQSLELARVLSQQLDIELDWRCIEKLKASLPQTALSATRRKQGPKGTFKLKYKPPFNYVAIVDDVMTTGATVREIAKQLRRAGVGRVDVWVMARTFI